jgi:signal transduction histidine kinase
MTASTTTRRWSVRHTLLAVLLGLTLALWGASAAIVYVEAAQESDELFDQSLVETSHLLLSLVENEVREHGLEKPIELPMRGHPNPRRYLLFQVKDVHHRILYKNDGAPETPMAAGAPDGLSWTTLKGQQWRLYALWNDTRELQLTVAEPTSHRDDISSRFFYKILIYGVLMVALAAGAIWWSINRVFRVLRRSTDEVLARTPNDLGDVNLDGAPSEMHALLAAINRLFGRVRHTMEYEQRFTADAAHELRTPLAAIKTNLQVLQRARNDAERAEFIAGLSASVDRASRLVDQLLTLARLDPHTGALPALAPGDLALLLAEQQDQWQQTAARKQQALTIDITPAPCAMQADGIRILVRNLVDNALRYTPETGAITVTCGQQSGASYLQVADSGPGIPESMRERVFERFFRLSGAQIPGSGLGLSIVRSIAERHDMRLEMGPGLGLEGSGLTVTVRFQR